MSGNNSLNNNAHFHPYAANQIDDFESFFDNYQTDDFESLFDNYQTVG